MLPQGSLCTIGSPSVPVIFLLLFWCFCIHLFLFLAVTLCRFNLLLVHLIFSAHDGLLRHQALIYLYMLRLSLLFCINLESFHDYGLLY
jgi:hypothetical protein